MILDDLVRVNLGPMPTSKQPYIEPTFENYRTVAFAVDFMHKCIGYGQPTFREITGEFLGFRERSGDTINVAVWLGFVPEVYRAEVVRGAEVVGQRFVNEKANRGLLRSFIEALHRWIGENVEPIT